nr:ROK family protein [uncultured Agathobaculum sp.]
MRIGIDLGGTTVKAALCKEDGTLLRKQSAATPTGNAPALCAAMKRLALGLCSEEGIAPETVTSIGIGVPGSFDKASCTLKFGTNLGMNNVSFAGAFRPEFSCPVQLDNDANCAALGEVTAGAAKGAKNMVMITLGTGVGGGVIIDGRLYTGCNGIAGELGHIVIRQRGEPCGCGRQGCLEAYASASALVRFAERALAQGRESILRKQAGGLNAKMICDAVDAGDALARELFDEYCVNLSCGLANLINIFQPETIVLGGGLAGYGEKLLEPLRRLTHPQTFRGDDKNTVITCALLGNDAGLIGAAML